MKFRGCAATVKPENLRQCYPVQEIMTERLSAFDIRAYLKLSPLNGIKAFSDDLSSLVMEASTSPDQRVTYWETTPDKVVEGLDPNDHTCKATYQIQSLMKERQKGSGETSSYVIVWISPASLEHGYPLSRLNFYIGKNGKEKHEVYSVAADWNLHKCEELHNWLKYFDIGNESGDEMTPQCILVPDEIEPLSYLRPYVDLPTTTWDFIFSGEARRKRKEAFKLAQTIAPALIYWLRANPNISALEAIKAGAGAEIYMARGGFSMRGKGTMCGLTNSEMVSSLTSLELPKLLEVDEKKETGDCPAIFCPNCKWVPTETQLQELSRGTLTCCPDCKYDPTTKSTPPEYSEPTVSEMPEFQSPKILEFSSAEPVSEDNSLPWSIYFFNPQLDTAPM